MAVPDDPAETDALRAWTAQLQSALDLADLAVDVDAVLGLAGVVAHAVVRPAAPLSAFLVGYAAGRRAAEGADPATAVDDAIAMAQALARSRE